MKLLILALMLAVSHVALISHVTAHFSPDLGHCELCVSQAQLSAAIPSAEPGISFDPGFAMPPPDAAPGTIQACSTRTCRQRAPPAAS